MRVFAALLSCSLIGATVGAAQEKRGVEIGTSLGVTILSQSGASATFIGVPAALGAAAQPAIYATMFASPSLMIEPQLGFVHVSENGSSQTYLDLAAQLGYLVTPQQKGSAYVAANLAYQAQTASFATLHGAGAGAEIGHRVKAGAGFAIRFAARYRHWFGDFGALSEYGFGLGLGAVVR